MKISFKQFLNNNHSWGTVGCTLARQLKKFGNEISLCSTNGYEFFPKDLEEDVKCKNCTVDHLRSPEFCSVERDHDVCISYTLPINWSNYLNFGEKKIAIYNYDGNMLPQGWAKHHRHCDLVLPSSEYSYDTFVAAGIPKDKLKILPHGYDEEFTARTEVYPLKTQKKYKILINVQQPHHRKNLLGALEALGRAFTVKDDVAVVFKVSTKKPKSNYDVNFMDLLKQTKFKYPRFPETIILDKFIDHISDLYRAVDIVFSCSHIECFHLPSLEGMVCNKLIIASAFGGNTNFMNKDNSLLIDGKIGRAPPNCQYWNFNPIAEMFIPDTNIAAEILRTSVNNYDDLRARFAPGVEKVKMDYSWANQAKNLLDIINSI